MIDATRTLVSGGDVKAVCLGCAGMVGMDAWVREACVEELGEKEGKGVRIVDGVKAGVAILQGIVRDGDA
jgi:Asp/Glu/hydantoin racemase